jgi:uncharacterized membrane-anchored protein
MRPIAATLLASTLLCAGMMELAFAQPQEAAAPSAEDTAAAEAQAREFLASLKPQSGAVALPGGRAALNLSDEFRYLDPEDTTRLLEEGWGNPPGSAEGTLGMLLPAGVSPLSPEGWGVVITYADDGHVSDDDADKIDYDDLLRDMQKAAVEESKEREKQGYDALQLAGWAEPPHYDKAEHKIYWAKDLAIGTGGEAHTLNYFIRVLGREGVLELNAVAGMNQLDQVRKDMKDVVAMASFTDGNRYADFNPSSDKVAAYGLAALVAGGVAAKTGLFAKLLALLIAAKKVIAVAVFGLFGLVAKFFKRGGR